MNAPLLKSKMALFGDNQNALAEFLQITKSTLSLKIHGQAEFKQSEIIAIACRYNLTPEEVHEMFLSEVKGS